MRRSLRIVLAATVALTGCNALLDVKDIYFDPNADGGSGAPDGSSTDAATNVEGSTGEAGADTSTCVADLSTDPKNCGRCGHDCVGGACAAGKCAPVPLGTVSNAPLEDMVVTDSFVFVSTRVTLVSQRGGVWRLGKSGGTPEPYVTLGDVRALAVLADKLYFVVNDNPAGTAGQFGGLYSCPIVGAAPCTPTLIAAATSSRAITVDQNKVYYGDDVAGRGLMVYTPPTVPPVVFRADYGGESNYYVDGNHAFYSFTFSPPSPPNRAIVLEALADGGADEKYSYASATADDGRMVGTPAAIYFSAYDFSGTTSGVMRRIPRAGGSPCDYGGNANKRPYGIHVDGTRIYWTNLGDGADEPFLNGSVVSCEQNGCCTTPDVMWTGNGEPTAIAGDANAVYFANHTDGAIWKVAKP